MGLTAALQVGRSALLSYQAALQLVGNNIANAGNPAYTRQSADLTAIPGVAGRIAIGGGVALSALRRNISEAVEARLRNALSDRASAGAEDAGLRRLEAIFNALGDANLGNAIQQFFNSFAALQNAPEDTAARGLVLTAGSQLAAAIQKTRADILGARDEINAELNSAVADADQLTAQIADLNVRIVAVEAGGAAPAAALRDQRDALLAALAGYLQITTREQPDGAVNVYAGNEPLVLFGTTLGLKAVQEIDAAGLVSISVRLKATNAPVPVGSGQIEGLLASRDQHSALQLERLDRLAAALIHQVNRVHSQGQGLRGFSTHTGQYAVASTSDPLIAAAAGLAFPPQSGTFFIDVRDAASGTVVRTQMHVDLDGIGGNDTTLDSLAADINASVANLTATVQPDGTLSLSAADGFTFTFADDTSGVLASLGLNAFFAGADASTIALNDLIAANPDFIAAGLTGLPGDGENAGRVADVLNVAVASLGGATLADYYAATVSLQATSASAARSALSAAETILGSLVNQRESISGVNLDEETLRLVTYQRSFQGAARYVTVVDELLQTLLGLVR